MGKVSEYLLFPRFSPYYFTIYGTNGEFLFNFSCKGFGHREVDSTNKKWVLSNDNDHNIVLRVGQSYTIRVHPICENGFPNEEETEELTFTISKIEEIVVEDE